MSSLQGDGWASRHVLACHVAPLHSPSRLSHLRERHVYSKSWLYSKPHKINVLDNRSEKKVYHTKRNLESLFLVNTQHLEVLETESCVYIYSRVCLN